MIFDSRYNQIIIIKRTVKYLNTFQPLPKLRGGVIGRTNS